jgi:NAD(P)-dependent dehydrogenase (short-subunit alcohol dehydrogenase family)
MDEGTVTTGTAQPPRSLSFLITGVSSGLGRALATAALADGHTVVGTVRRDQDAEDFAALGERAVARMLDVTNDEAVFAAVAEVQARVGPIDVVVANAGYGQEGTLEESSMGDLRAQFDTNVFGAVATIKAVLPSMRERRSGHVIGITSMGGMMTIPGLAFYHGSKFALEGILGSLAKEVAQLGIHVTAVEPGSFRTDWAGRSMVRSPSTIADYESVFAPLRAMREAASGNQLGDPDKAAAAILQIIGLPEPPVHLLLGSDAIRLVERERAAVEEELRRWEPLARSTDFADGAQIG